MRGGRKYATVTVNRLRVKVDRCCLPGSRIINYATHLSLPSDSHHVTQAARTDTTWRFGGGRRGVACHLAAEPHASDCRLLVRTESPSYNRHEKKRRNKKQKELVKRERRREQRSLRADVDFRHYHKEKMKKKP